MLCCLLCLKKYAWSNGEERLGDVLSTPSFNVTQKRKPAVPLTAQIGLRTPATSQLLENRIVKPLQWFTIKESREWAAASVCYLRQWVFFTASTFFQTANKMVASTSQRFSASTLVHGEQLKYLLRSQWLVMHPGWCRFLLQAKVATLCVEFERTKRVKNTYEDSNKFAWLHAPKTRTSLYLVVEACISGDTFLVCSWVAGARNWVQWFLMLHIAVYDFTLFYR